MSLKQAIDAVQDELATENEAIAKSRESIKNLLEELNTLKIEAARLQRGLEHKRKQEEGRKWAKENPKEHTALMEDLRHRNQEEVIEGFLDGWWDLDEDGNMLAPVKVFNLSDFTEVKNPLMAHVMAKAGIFTSVGQARKNGWDKPLTTGEWSVTKKKIRIRIEE